MQDQGGAPGADFWEQVRRSVIGGSAVLDESALTGEAKPVEHRDRDKVLSGTVNASKTPFKLRAIASAGESTSAVGDRSHVPLTRGTSSGRHSSSATKSGSNANGVAFSTEG